MMLCRHRTFLFPESNHILFHSFLSLLKESKAKTASQIQPIKTAINMLRVSVPKFKNLTAAKAMPAVIRHTSASLSISSHGKTFPKFLPDNREEWNSWIVAINSMLISVAAAGPSKPIRKYKPTELTILIIKQ